MAKPAAASSPQSAFATEGSWLAHGQQQTLLHFRPQSDPRQECWIEVRRFHWMPPHLPEPQGREVMPLDQAMDRWISLHSSGWRRVSAPPR